MTMLTKEYKGYWLHFNSDAPKKEQVRVQTPDYEILGRFSSERAARKAVRDDIAYSHNMKKNPHVSKHAQIEAQINAASQRPHRTKTGAVTKKPTERLKTRRAKNKHDGYFPNPVINTSDRPNKTVLRKEHGNYVVTYANGKAALDSDGGRHLATFTASDEAFAFAKWWATNNPKYYVSVDYAARYL